MIFEKSFLTGAENGVRSDSRNEFYCNISNQINTKAQIN